MKWYIKRSHESLSRWDSKIIPWHNYIVYFIQNSLQQYFVLGGPYDPPREQKTVHTKSRTSVILPSSGLLIEDFFESQVARAKVETSKSVLKRLLVGHTKAAQQVLIWGHEVGRVIAVQYNAP